MRLGIMGGTFDPIHNGHLFVAEESRLNFQLDRILFVPNGSPPHKQESDVTAEEHRYEMTRLAILSNLHFQCDDLELKRQGPSYAVDTLKELKNNHSGAELFYIAGMDALAELLTWKNHAAVIEMATFIAATRPGYDTELLRKRLPEHYLNRIVRLDVYSVGLDISSTAIRSRLSVGESVRYLMPDSVLEYIEANQLYNHRHKG